MRSIILFRRLIVPCCGLVAVAMCCGNVFATCTSSKPNSTTANVICDAATDQVTLTQAFGGWIHQGSSAFGSDPFDWDTMVAGQQPVANGGTINVYFTGNGGQLTLGNTAAAPADALVGSVTIGSNGSNPPVGVTFDASASTTGHTYRIDDGVGGSGATTVNSLTFNESTSAGKSVIISTGSGSDIVNVWSVSSSDTFMVVGNSAGTSIPEIVNVGKAGNLQNIQGSIDFSSPNGYWSLNIDDSTDMVARNATLSGTGTIGSLTGAAPGTISWAADAVNAITLKMGTGNDTLSVQDLANPHGVTSLTVQGTNGNDAVTIGGSSGGVQGIFAPISIYNSLGHTQLSIDDSADTSAQNATVIGDSSTAGVSGVAPAPIGWKSADISSINLTMGLAADTVVVKSIDNLLNIQGTNGLDSVILGNSVDGVQKILKPIHIANQKLLTILTIDDAADKNPQTATVTDTTLNISAISGAAPAVISWRDLDVLTVNLTMGIGADTVNVQQLFNLLNIQGTNGLDQVNIGSGSSVQSIRAPITIANATSRSIVSVDASADASPSEAHYTATGIFGLTPGGISWTGTDVSSESLSVGNGGNIVHITGSNDGASHNISLGNGKNLCIIDGAGLGVNSTNNIFGGSSDDTFVISPIPTPSNSNITGPALYISGGAENTVDKIIYTGRAQGGPYPVMGTLVPNDINAPAQSIQYSSIESFTVHDTIFLDDFE
jgi:hypothetical protein